MDFTYCRSSETRSTWAHELLRASCVKCGSRSEGALRRWGLEAHFKAHQKVHSLDGVVARSEGAKNARPVGQVQGTGPKAVTQEASRNPFNRGGVPSGIGWGWGGRLGARFEGLGRRP